MANDLLTNLFIYALAVLALFALVAAWLMNRESVKRAIAEEESAHVLNPWQALSEGHEWLLLLDTEGHIIQASPNMTRALGLAQAPTGQRLYDILQPLVLDSTPLSRLQAGLSARETIRVTLTLQLPQAEGPSALLLLARPWHDADGNNQGFRVSTADVTAEQQREDELRALAFTDVMTGLNNRPWLLREIEQALQRQQARALFHLHFPRLVSITNSLGRTQAELFMVNVASRLREGLNAYHQVARTGPTSFAVLEKNGAPNTPVLNATELGRVLAKPFSLIDHDVQLIPAIGVAHCLPGTREAEQWLADAELATTRLTVRNKPAIAEYDPTARDRLIRMRALETDLRRAIYFEPSQLMGYYQPIYGLNGANGKEELIGFEMLARWVHHLHGMIPPLDFIPVAEDSGLIAPLWVHLYARAMKDLQRWNAARPTGAQPLFMSVNLSSRQFLLPGLIRTVDVLAEVTGVPPAHVKLELTETEMMEDTEHALQQMQALRARGFGLSVDDFGTGFSSLSYLHKLPVTDVKIDRSFIKTMHDSAGNLEIVGTIVRLAGLLGHTTTAEGIETAADLQALRTLGCTNGQGFYFKKPLPAHEIDALLAAA